MRRLRWFLGLIALGVSFALVFFYPLPSLLSWQSDFLKHAFFILIISASFSLWRILRGPTAADRAVALDILGILIIGFCAILGIPTGRDWYIDIGIAWALQSFISILTLGKYLEGRRFDE
ncbi:MAG: cation:proton antiporter [Candidatus Omnitrophica bacterium]|nr:cation:proton antiporter [Candidatus Omnitrophota bacterium]MDD5653138.1 cation:proton antiporter [Candidatus Omnitrophota bacterium]